MSDANAPAMPSTVQPAPAATGAVTGETFDVAELSKDRPVWRLELPPDRVRLHPPDGSAPFDIFRFEAEKKITVLVGLLLGRVMTAQIEPKRKVALKLTPAALEAMDRWMGREMLLATSLKRSLSWAPALAVIFILTALPIRLPDGQSLDFEPISLALGIVLLGLWLWAKLKPQAWLVLATSLWMIGWSAWFGIFVAWRGHWFWWILAALLLMSGIGGIRLYGRLSRLRAGTAGASAA